MVCDTALRNPHFSHAPAAPPPAHATRPPMPCAALKHHCKRIATAAASLLPRCTPLRALAAYHYGAALRAFLTLSTLPHAHAYLNPHSAFAAARFYLRLPPLRVHRHGIRRGRGMYHAMPTYTLPTLHTTTRQTTLLRCAHIDCRTRCRLPATLVATAPASVSMASTCRRWRGHQNAGRANQDGKSRMARGTKERRATHRAARSGETGWRIAPPVLARIRMLYLKQNARVLCTRTHAPLLTRYAASFACA